MKSIQVIQLINQWKSNCYLSNYSFDCPAHLIDDALAKFQSDYNRWYEGVIDIKRLSLTPQLQTVLCYRIANNVYKNGGGGSGNILNVRPRDWTFINFLLIWDRRRFYN